MTFFDIYGLIVLFTFYTLLISKTVMTQKQGQKVIALGKNKRGLSKYLEYFFYLGLILLTYLVVMAAFGKAFLGIEVIHLFNHWMPTVIGFILHNISIILFAFALASFKTAWRIGVDYEQNHVLITTGIFKFSRNPTYLSIFLLFLGYFLIYPNFFFLGATLFIFFAFNHQINKEEKQLEKSFHSDYLNYKACTPKYFGFKKLKKFQ